MQVEELKHERNKASEQIVAMKKEGADTAVSIEQRPPGQLPAILLHQRQQAGAIIAARQRTAARSAVAETCSMAFITKFTLSLMG